MGKSAIIAIDLETDLVGELWFQFFIDSSWYPNYPPSLPTAYEIQLSADSTDGQDGTWLTVQTINDNNRATRTHRFTVPTGNYHWIRLHVTDGHSDAKEPTGKDLRVREIRVYRPDSAVALPDTFALYGDSLVANSFDAISTSGFAQAVQNKRGDTHDLILFTFGLAGQNSSGFLDSSSEVDIVDALNIDQLHSNSRFWGISIGTNDAIDGAAGLTQPDSNLSQYDERLEALINRIITNGGVPIIARIPDTDESRGGFGDLPAKKKLLADIDHLAAVECQLKRGLWMGEGDQCDHGLNMTFFCAYCSQKLLPSRHVEEQITHCHRRARRGAAIL